MSETNGGKMAKSAWSASPRQQQLDFGNDDRQECIVGALVAATGGLTAHTCRALFGHTPKAATYYSEPGSDRIPVYEPDMIQQWDHRGITFDGGELKQPTAEDKSNCLLQTSSRYWIGEWDAATRIVPIPPELARHISGNNQNETSMALKRWLAGYNLNRGDEGNDRRAAIGEQLAMEIASHASSTAITSWFEYRRNLDELRELERRYPLTELDIGFISYWCEEHKHDGNAAVDCVAMVSEMIKRKYPDWLIACRLTTRRTDARTLVSAVVPNGALGPGLAWISAPHTPSAYIALVHANLNTFALDYMLRTQMDDAPPTCDTIQQLPVLPVERFTPSIVKVMLPHIVELTYTAHDLSCFAAAMGCYEVPFCWDDARRFLLRCELDAAYFHLYGIQRDDVDYIMETFPIVKRKDEKAYGEYRTKRVILEMYDQMAEAAATGSPYQTWLDPPPANRWTPPVELIEEALMSVE